MPCDSRTAWRHLVDMIHHVRFESSVQQLTQPFHDPSGLASVSGAANGGFAKLHAPDATTNPPPAVVDCSTTALPTWTVVDVVGDDDPKLYLDAACSVSSSEFASRLLDKLLPHVRRNGEPVTKEQCFVHTASYAADFGNGVFPIIHRDGQWSGFGHSDGFQIWLLVEYEDALGNGTGRLLMADHDESEQARQAAAYFLQTDDGRIHKLNAATSELLQEYASLDAAGLTLRRPRLKVGQAILWHKAMLHTSDPRPFTGKRISLTIRFLVARPGQVTFDAWHHNLHVKKQIEREVRNGRGHVTRRAGWSVISPGFTTLAAWDMADDLGIWGDRALNPLYTMAGLRLPLIALSLAVPTAIRRAGALAVAALALALVARRWA
jgi:hypothetical protein